jgi:hypothetical protein
LNARATERLLALQQILRDLLPRPPRHRVVVREGVRGDLVRRRRRPQRRGRELHLAPDGEKGRPQLQLREQLAEPAQRHLRHRPQRAIVERAREAVDGRVTTQAIEIDRDAPQRLRPAAHGVRRDSSCR